MCQVIFDTDAFLHQAPNLDKKEKMKNTRNFKNKLKNYRRAGILLGTASMAIALPLAGISISRNIPVAIAPMNKSIQNEIIAKDNGELVLNKIIPGSEVHAYDSRILENRRYNHSDYQPTGVFLAANKPVTINISSVSNSDPLFPKEGVYAVVGQEIGFKGINNGVYTPLQKFALKNGINTFTPTIDGILSIFDYGKSSVTINTVSAENVNLIPTFIQDQTNLADFIAQANSSPVDVVQIIGKSFYMTFEKSLVLRVFNQGDLNDLNEKTHLSDFNIAKINELYGLNEDYDGVAHKFNHLIQFYGSDTDGGWANYVSTGFVSLHNYSGESLLKGGANSWGFWHEIGHSYQTLDYMWDKLNEVTTNIPGLYLTDYYGLNYRPQDVSAAKTFLALPDDKRIFDGDNRYYKIAMFGQLNLAFGKNFYPNLSQYYRVLAASGDARPATSDEKEQMFMIAASKVAQRNLISFWKRWGMPITAATEKAINDLNLPTLEKPIWDNIVKTAKVVENDLPEYSPTRKDFYDSGTIPFAEPYDKGNYDSFFIHNTPITRVKSDFMKLSKIDGIWTVPTKVWQKGFEQAENIFNDTHWVSMDNMDLVKVLGTSNGLSGFIAANQLDRKIYFLGNTQKFSTQTPTDVFGTLTIKDNGGNVVRTITMLNGDNMTKIIADNNLSDGIDFIDGGSITMNFSVAKQAQLFDKLKNDFSAFTQSSNIFNFY